MSTSKMLLPVKRPLPALARPLPWADWYGEWPSAIDAGPLTKKAYLRAVARFLRFYGHDRPTRETIIAWRDKLTAEGLKAGSVNLYLSALQSFFKWLESNRRYPNICAGVKGVRESKRFVKGTLAPAQIKHILDGIPRETVKGKRDFALLSLIARTGMRCCEAARARLVDVREESGRWTLWVRGKGHTEADMPVVLNQKALDAINEYLSARSVGPGAKEPLFATVGPRGRGGNVKERQISAIWKRYAGKAGFKEFGIHSLRHSAATIALRAGAGIEAVQEMLRHSRIDTTRRYLHLDRYDHPPEDLLDW